MAREDLKTTEYWYVFKAFSVNIKGRKQMLRNYICADENVFRNFFTFIFRQ